MITIDAADQAGLLAKSIRSYANVIVVNQYNLSVKYFPNYVADIVECVNLLVFLFTAGKANDATKNMFRSMYATHHGAQIQYADRIIKIA